MIAVLASAQARAFTHGAGMAGVRVLRGAMAAVRCAVTSKRLDIPCGAIFVKKHHNPLVPAMRKR